MDTSLSHCVSCECELSESDAHIFDDEYYCEDCLHDETFLCDRRGERHFQDDRYGGDDYDLCERCYDEHYYRCDGCGRVIPKFDAYYLSDDTDCDSPYCYECYAEHLYCKRDGSIENGFEMVTHPMSLDYHINKMPWSAVLKSAISMGYLSHNTSTCGLRIHVSRDAFDEFTSQQEACIARILYFVENHWQELLKFSRRTQYQLDQWASRYGRANSSKEALDTAKKGGKGRYTCVNLQNYSTIEFRIFKGTLLYSTLIATLQLVEKKTPSAVCCAFSRISLIKKLYNYRILLLLFF